jgi:hypothetical protein
MSLVTWIAGNRTERKIAQMKNNAGEDFPAGTKKLTLMKALGVASLFLLMLTSLSVPVAAQTTFGINGTQIDAAFSLLNNNILPDVGQTISAMPAIIIPLVILVVLIIIVMFVPELLYSLIDMVKESLHFHKP